MRTELLLALSLVAVGVAGCTTQNPSFDAPGTGEQALETIAQGQDSRIEDQETHVIRDFGAWGDLWTRHYPEKEGAPGTESIPIPNLNFSEVMVLAVFQGTSGDTCHRAEITGAAYDDQENRVVVNGTWWVPGPSSVCGEAITHPYHIVKAPLFTGDVVFEMETQEIPPAGPPGDDPGQDPDQPASNDTHDIAGEPGSMAPFTTIERGQNSDVENRTEVVIRANTTWQALWANHTADQMDPPPAPEVDFDQRMVVAIFKGQSPNDCHGAEIENATWQEDGVLQIQGAYVTPTGAMCTQQVTYPFHMIELDRYDGQVVFDTTEETREA